jgi:hypothetical protein
MNKREFKLLSVVVISLAFGAIDGRMSYRDFRGHLLVICAIAVTVLFALIRGRKRQKLKSLNWLRSTRTSIYSYFKSPNMWGTGVLIWLLFFLAYFSWDLNSFLHQSHNLPTLSYLIGRITRFYFGKFALTTVWLIGGWYLASGMFKKQSAVDRPEKSSL